MTQFPVLSIHFNSDDYPYDYHLAIWKNADLFYISEDGIITTFDQFLTIGQVLRLMHTGKADTDYSWHNIEFFSGSDLQKKLILGMRCEELMDSGITFQLPLMMIVRFPGRRNLGLDVTRSLM